MTLDPAFEAAIHERMSSSGFASWMGMRLVAVGDGTSQIAIDLEPHHRNPGGIVHGGIIATILDAAIGLALRTTIGMRGHVTVQLGIQYIAPAVDGVLTAHGRAVHSGKRIGHGEAEAFDERGTLIARGTGTFLVIDPGAIAAGD